MHLGHNSTAAIAVALSKRSDEEVVQNLIGNTVLPLFGLDNESATYPFTDIWGVTDMPTRVKRVCTLIPPDVDCFRYIRQYRDNAHILYPGLVDIDQLQADLTKFLITRSQQPAGMDDYRIGSSRIFGQDVHWLSLLFACLASGCQCSPLPRKERQLTAQVYGKILSNIAYLAFVWRLTMLC